MPERKRKEIKEKKLLEILKILGLMEIINYFRNSVEGNIRKKFRLKNIGETTNHFLKEKKQKLIDK